MIHVLSIDPYHKTTGLLIPTVAQRIHQTAEEHFEEMSPLAFVRMVMSRLWVQDPTILVLVLWDEEKQAVVGHGIATVETDGTNRWVYVGQVRADGNVGDSVKLMIQWADKWGQSFGCKKMVMATSRSDTAWHRKYGFSTMRHLMLRNLGSDGPS